MKPVNRDGLLVPVCPYCRVEAVLQYRAHGRRWECPVPGCDARVGVHRDSPRGAPLGTLARGPLRARRQEVHEQFDPLWRDTPERRFPSRHAAYAWLAKFLEIQPARCHIGEFDEATCARALALIHDLKEVPR